MFQKGWYHDMKNTSLRQPTEHQSLDEMVIA